MAIDGNLYSEEAIRKAAAEFNITLISHDLPEGAAGVRWEYKVKGASTADEVIDRMEEFAKRVTDLQNLAKDVHSNPVTEKPLTDLEWTTQSSPPPAKPPDQLKLFAV